jgi:hypothetical protein
MEERPLEYWCDMMIKTYNTSILDNFPQSLKSSLAKQCVESKPNPNSYTDFFGLIKRKKNRNVLMRLINNYFRSKQIETIPTIDFIGGPHTLTLHWSAEYNKIIYIFGEIHRNDVCDYDNMMLVENYLKNLFRRSSAFIDFFLEIQMFTKGKYDRDFFTTLGVFRLWDLRIQNIKCIESGQRQKNRECHNRRVHFVDIRFIPVDSKGRPVININSTITLQNYLEDFIKKYDYAKTQDEHEKNILKDKKYIIDSLKYIFMTSYDNKATIDFILYGSSETYKAFYEKEIETHELVNYELSESTEKGKIREFAEEEFEKIRDEFITISDRIKNYLIKYSDENGKYDFYKLSDYDCINFIDCLSNFKYRIRDFTAIMVDIYTLARMFKEFKLNNTRNTRKTDEPKEPHNIIMYAGNAHSESVRRFLDEKLEFDLISESKGDPKFDFCVDIRQFEQPFFSSWPPKKILDPIISDFQIILESRNEIDEDETQLETLIYEGALIYKGSNINFMNIKDLSTVSITFYSSELTEYNYYTYNSMSKPIKWKSYNVQYQGIIRQSTNFIMHSDKMVKKYPFLENFKYIDYFFLIVFLQKALESKIISDSSNIILEARIPSEELNSIKSMIKILEHYEVIGFEQMFPEDYEKVMENLDVNENNYIPMTGNVKTIMYLFRIHRRDFKVAYELLDEPTTRQNSFSVTSSIKKSNKS